MRLTIREVAQEAGVSTATVSHVLNQTGQVSRATRRRVQATVKRLGYFPNVHARNLASNRSRTLGIMVSDIENPFFPEVIKALAQAGCRVRQDISVTGFENNHLSEYSTPSITTVDVHRDLLGTMAADALHELASSDDSTGREFLIHADLIIRDSTAQPPHWDSGNRSGNAGYRRSCFTSNFPPLCRRVA